MSLGTIWVSSILILNGLLYTLRPVWMLRKVTRDSSRVFGGGTVILTRSVGAGLMGAGFAVLLYATLGQSP